MAIVVDRWENLYGRCCDFGAFQMTVGRFNIVFLGRGARLSCQNNRLPPERWKLFGKLISSDNSRAADVRKVIADNENVP